MHGELDLVKKKFRRKKHEIQKWVLSIFIQICWICPKIDSRKFLSRNSISYFFSARTRAPFFKNSHIPHCELSSSQLQRRVSQWLRGYNSVSVYERYSYNEHTLRKNEGFWLLNYVVRFKQLSTSIGLSSLLKTANCEGFRKARYAVCSMQISCSRFEFFT